MTEGGVNPWWLSKPDRPLGGKGAGTTPGINLEVFRVMMAGRPAGGCADRSQLELWWGVTEVGLMGTGLTTPTFRVTTVGVGGATGSVVLLEVLLASSGLEATGTRLRVFL